MSGFLLNEQIKVELRQVVVVKVVKFVVVVVDCSFRLVSQVFAKRAILGLKRLFKKIAYLPQKFWRQNFTRSA